ncbi:MAG TPA: SDR family oxidoreductase [Steroidobacteraceae bacterium]|nr:SDR family oxidoreductase [Steroidobacteraceae bacterium]
MPVSDLFDVGGKVALVTGGAHGLGRMMAQGLLEAGARVYITSRKADAAERAARELGTGCVGLAADLGQPEAAVSLAQRLRERESRLDILVNNAGRTWGAPLATFPDQAWGAVMAVNVQAPFTLVRELLDLLRAAGSPGAPSRVINIGSLAGAVVERLNAYSYAASKAAIQHLSRVLAADLAGHHIAVNVIVPGFFPTQMTAHIREDAAALAGLVARVPLGRLGKADDIVGACLFLCSRAGSYLTGAALFLDGGMAGCR